MEFKRWTRHEPVLGPEQTDGCCWKGRQRGQEWICSHLEGMGARASMEKFILERRKLEETQADSSGGRDALSE